MNAWLASPQTQRDCGVCAWCLRRYRRAKQPLPDPPYLFWNWGSLEGPLEIYAQLFTVYLTNSLHNAVRGNLWASSGSGFWGGLIEARTKLAEFGVPPTPESDTQFSPQYSRPFLSTSLLSPHTEFGTNSKCHSSQEYKTLACSLKDTNTKDPSGEQVCGV